MGRRDFRKDKNHRPGLMKDQRGQVAGNAGGWQPDSKKFAGTECQTISEQAK
jgi:hypothetical protein